MSKITLLGALAEIANAPEGKSIAYRLVYKETKRYIQFGKYWHKGKFEYAISEPYVPTFIYTEEQFVGALANCSPGIGMHFQEVPYTIERFEMK